LLPAATAPLMVVAAEALLLLLAAVSTDKLRELSSRPKLVLCHVGRRCRNPAAGVAEKCHAEGNKRVPHPAATAVGAQPPQLPRCSMLQGAMMCLAAPTRTRASSTLLCGRRSPAPPRAPRAGGTSCLPH
jgi:hypothetical protein